MIDEDELQKILDESEDEDLVDGGVNATQGAGTADDSRRAGTAKKVKTKFKRFDFPKAHWPDHFGDEYVPRSQLCDFRR